MEITEQITNILAGGVLQQMRRDARLIGTDINDSLNIIPGTLSKIENGKQCITFFQIQQFLILYKKSMLDYMKMFNHSVDQYRTVKAKTGTTLSDVAIANFVVKNYIDP